MLIKSSCGRSLGQKNGPDLKKYEHPQLIPRITRMPTNRVSDLESKFNLSSPLLMLLKREPWEILSVGNRLIGSAAASRDCLLLTFCYEWLSLTPLAVLFFD